MDKIEPKFHVGDVVTNISGLYPNVTPTINEVDIINQCYRYKEIGGITWFKEQDKLKLVDTKPIFKIGDKVKGMFDNPNKVCVINYINNEFKCYHFFNNSITINFKDQYKLTLVETDNCRHPVKDNTITNNKFIKIMINNVEMVYGLNGIAHDVLYYIGSIISGRGIDDENRFIININADFHHKASIKLKTSTASTRRGVKELIEKGLLLKEDNDAKNDYLFNFMVMYKGTDEDYAKDCDKYNINIRYEMAINH